MYSIIFNPLIDNEILEKDDGVVIDLEQRPWLKYVPDAFIRDNKTTSDISMFYYLKWKFPRLKLNLLNPQIMTYHNLSQHRLNFYFTYNRGEAYTFDTRPIYQRVSKLLDHPNIYPPTNWQYLVDHKQRMFDYLKDRNINVLPYLYIPSSIQTSPKSMIIDFMNTNNIQKVIIRPEFGTTSLDVITTTQDELDSQDLANILRKYPGLIVTEYLTSVRDHGEYKVYFINDTPHLIYHLKQDVEDLVDEEQSDAILDPHHPDNEHITKTAHAIFDILPPFKYNKSIYPKIITRIDLAYDGNNDLFVTEIESVPSLLGSIPGIQMDVVAAHQLIKVIHHDVLTSTNVYIYIRFTIFILMCMTFIAIIFFVRTKTHLRNI